MGAFHGNFGALVRAYAYIRTLGKQGVPKVSEDAVINANYIRSQLKGFFDLPLGVILQNIASAILLTLQDITSMKSFTDINLIKNIFLKENRILYIGIFISVLAVFIFLFFG